MVTIIEQSSLELTNPGPRVSDLQRSANRLFRGTNSRLEYLPSTNTVSPRFSSTFGIMGGESNLQPEGGSWTATTMMPYGLGREK